jgi:hypothetical protein
MEWQYERVIKDRAISIAITMDLSNTAFTKPSFMLIPFGLSSVEELTKDERNRIHDDKGIIKYVYYQGECVSTIGCLHWTFGPPGNTPIDIADIAWMD